jgi:sulfur carrier protein
MSNNADMRSISIQLNAVETTINAGMTLDDYIQKSEIGGRFIMVVNDQIVPKSAYRETMINDGDKLDVMSPISGG